jgi:hypothetical protein
MRILSYFIIQFLFLNSLAFGFCQDLYKQEIIKLNEGLKAIGNNPAAGQVIRRKDSLAIINDVLFDISRNNVRGAATQKYSQMTSINPKTIHNILRRANKRNELCVRGVLLDASEVEDLIKKGKLL